MDTVLPIAIALVALVVASAVVCLPAIWLGVRAARKAPEHAARRTVAWALGGGAWTGALLAAGGIAVGAGVGDENAGEIIGVLASGGCVGGVVAGAVTTFLGMRWWLRR